MTTEPESPAAELVRTGSMSLDLFEAFHDWRELPTTVASPVDAGPPSQVDLDLDNCKRWLGARATGAPLPDPVRYIRTPKNKSIMRHASSWPILVVLQEEESVLHGCGLSQTDSSSDTEILQGSDLQPVIVAPDSDDQPEDGELTPEPLPPGAPLGGKRKQPESGH